MRSRCKSGYSLNRETNRCRKKCISGTHRNPNTGRCVKNKSTKRKSIKRRISRKVTRKSKSRTTKCSRGYSLNRETNRCRKKCTSGTHRNPNTGRCIKNKSTKRKSIKRKSIKRKSIKRKSTKRKVKRAENKYGKKITKIETGGESKPVSVDIVYKLIDNEYIIGKQLGKGSFGAVYQLLNKITQEPEHYVLKIQVVDFKKKENINYHNEISLQQKLAENSLAPEILKEGCYQVSSNQLICAIIMEKIDGNLADLIKSGHLNNKQINDIFDRVSELIGFLESENICHGDLHTENLAYVKTIDESGKDHYDVLLIDFGFALDNYECGRLDFLQFIRGLEFDLEDLNYGKGRYFNKEQKQFLRKFLDDGLKHIMQMRTVPQARFSIEQEFGKLRDRLEKEMLRRKQQPIQQVMQHIKQI